MPAEWKPHAGTWLTWPWRDGCSYPDNYDAMVPAYAKLIRVIAEHERVNINVWDAEMEAWVRTLLTKEQTPTTNVAFHHNPSCEPWCRDHGPIFLIRDQAGRHERAIVDWGYNAWGGKYPPWELDDNVPTRIAEAAGLPLFLPKMILEGGSIEVNGNGTVLTTESCLLNPNRNPSLNREKIELHLRDFLGVSNILWLGEGIAGDDTDGHIDDMTRFVNTTTLITAIEEDPSDDNHEPLRDNLNRLRAMRDECGNPFRLVTLPMPARRLKWKGNRLPASYANFYIANGVVVMPTFADANDRRALETLQKLFPDRRVVGIDAREIIVGLGSFHCLTQQEPA